MLGLPAPPPPPSFSCKNPGQRLPNMCGGEVGRGGVSCPCCSEDQARSRTEGKIKITKLKCEQSTYKLTRRSDLADELALTQDSVGEQNVNGQNDSRRQICLIARPQISCIKLRYRSKQQAQNLTKQ
jgi:hypothetical protein